MKYLYVPPFPVRLLFPQCIWNTKAEKILLTFDDGPVPGNTEKILQKLDDYKIKSLFFAVGNNIIKNPGLASEILREGHTIGNHTMNHTVLPKVNKIRIEDEVTSFTRLSKDELGYTVKYFRPPHGRMNYEINNIVKRNGLKTIMWSLLTYDYKGDLAEVKKSLKYLKSESIVIFHDSIKSKNIITDALNLFIETAAKKNLFIGTPEECLK